MLGRTSTRAQYAANSPEVYRPDSTGRRNTPMVEVFMGRQPGWMVTQTGRPAMRSPGRPPIRREVEQTFWRKIAEGMTSEDAGVAVGVSGPVGSRWFASVAACHRSASMPLRVPGAAVTVPRWTPAHLLVLRDPALILQPRRLGRQGPTLTRPPLRAAREWDTSSHAGTSLRTTGSGAVRAPHRHRIRQRGPVVDL